MDAHQDQDRLHAINAILATTITKPTKTEAVWVTADSEGYRIAFEAKIGMNNAVFSLTKSQMNELVESALLLGYNLHESPKS